jgi:hypothetical protein
MSVEHLEKTTMNCYHDARSEEMKFASENLAFKIANDSFTVAGALQFLSLLVVIFNDIKIQQIVHFLFHFPLQGKMESSKKLRF